MKPVNAGLGDNYVSMPDAIYALGGHVINQPPKSLLVLDPATGATKQTITLPDSLGAWGLISICDSLIIATTQPMMFDSAKLGNGFIYWYSGNTSEVGVGGLSTYNATTSSRIVVLNRFTGAKLWDYKAEQGFFNNSIASGNGKIFAIDKLPATSIGLMKRMAGSVPLAKIKAFDALSGQLLWQDSSSAVFARYLAYSRDYNMLIEASRYSRDYVQNEPAANHMNARNATTGAILWSWTDTTKSYYGGPIILDDTVIITQDGNNFGMVNLKTGMWQNVNYGMTSAQEPFYFYRHYGCNYGLGSVNLVCFRTGSGGYFDLSKMDGISNLAGAKTGCTPAVVPADGILTEADLTRTCSCMYTLQTSAAFVYQPDVEKWTCNDGLAKQVKNAGFKYTNIGVLLGGAGDRRDDNGTFWMEYPTVEDKVGFPAYPMPLGVTVTGDSTTYFRHHSSRISRMSGDSISPKWVAASGAENMTGVTVSMYKDSLDGAGHTVAHTTASDLYNVTLYFMEPNPAATTGSRVFDVSVNGVSAATNLDIVQQAGAPYTVIAKTVQNVPVGDNVQIAFTAHSGKPIISGFSAAKVGGTAVLATNRTMNTGNLTRYTGNGLSAKTYDAIKDGVNTGIEAGLRTK